MPIYQSVGMHKSTSAGLHRATPLYYYIYYCAVLSIVIVKVIVCSIAKVIHRATPIYHVLHENLHEIMPTD